MTPDFKVLAAGFDITGQIKDRLISLSVSDEAGTKSDAVEIVMDDRDSALELPMPGAPLIVAMGYRETFLMPMGVFTSDEISLSGWPRTMTLRGKAANLGGEIKSQKSRSWDDKTIDDIVSTIAGEQGLQPKVADPLKAIKYKHLDQTDESDIHFLNRIGRDHDAMATVKGGARLFMARGRGLTVSGLAMLPRGVTRASVLSYGAELVNRANWKCVEATWHDLKAGQRKTVKAGSGAPVKRLRHVFPNEVEAKKAAEAALGEATRGTTSLNLTLIGDPTISAESRILVTGIRLGVDGLWSVKSARHSIGDSGFTTSIQAELPSA